MARAVFYLSGDEPDEEPNPKRREPPPWWTLMIGAMLIGALFVGLTSQSPRISAEAQRFKDLSSFLDSQLATNRTTTYGAPLRPWQRDTSREYHLSRLGLWDPDQPATTREYWLEVSDIMGAPDGVVKRMTVINGSYPGPLIEANEGDQLVVHVHNNGSQPTTIHFHGMFHRGTNAMDGVPGVTQCGIGPGQSFTYNFSLAGQYGTYWYHSHTSVQYLDGVLGPLVIHSKEDSKYQYDEELVIMITDLYHDRAEDVLHNRYMTPGMEKSPEPVPDAGLIQGRRRIDCSKIGGNRVCLQEESQDALIPVLENKVYRLRLISAGGFSEFDFSIDDHNLTVIEAEGTNVEPFEIEVVRLANAQRYSVLANFSKPREDADGYWLRATMNTNCYEEENPVLSTDLKAVLSYPSLTEATIQNKGIVPREPSSDKSRQLDGSVSCIELDSTLLHPDPPMKVPDATMFIPVDVSVQIKAKQLTWAYLNTTSYKEAIVPTLSKLYDAEYQSQVISDPSYNPAWADKEIVVPIMQEGQVIDFLINNYDDGGHPFHLHGHKFWVLAWGSGYYEPGKTEINVDNPIYRDTVQVKGFGWALVRFVADNPGIWLFHCHILWHAATGMAMQFNILPQQVLNSQALSAEWHRLCSS
ncbi:hypothetical protein TRVA0_048S00606 [Trichomonascus vanleenenianus]|uniref:uncharacterized protein n=1 Tax=Trichomonascus vanleenenianus TaxID=2268995 RepID=UPI003ECA7C85